MMRLLAWCGTNQSRSSAVGRRWRRTASPTTSVDACRRRSLKTSLPSMLAGRRSSSSSGAAIDIELVAMAAVGAQMRASGRRGRPRCPRLPRPSSTMAPAPSPNSTQVVRSFQSRMRENVSAPITSARLCEPVGQELVGGRHRVDEAGAHRLHVEGGAVVMPRSACTMRRGGREGEVRRRGGEDDQVDVGGRQAGVGERRLGGRDAERRRWSRRRPRYGAARCRCAARSTRREVSTVLREVVRSSRRAPADRSRRRGRRNG